MQNSGHNACGFWMSPESKDLGETALRIRQQFRSTTILIPAYGSPGGFSLLTKCNSRCDTCMQYASACGMSLCTTQPFVGSHINTFVTHTRGTTMTLGILSRSKQNARQHGARTCSVRAPYVLHLTAGVGVKLLKYAGRSGGGVDEGGRCG